MADEPKVGGDERSLYVCGDCGIDRQAGALESCPNCRAPASRWKYRIEKGKIEFPKDGGGPAYPHEEEYVGMQNNVSTMIKRVIPGMTLRQHAAIELRVPESGLEWLDRMIRRARYLDFAGQALNGMLSRSGGINDADAAIDNAYQYADEMVEAGDAK